MPWFISAVLLATGALPGDGWDRVLAAVGLRAGDPQLMILRGDSPEARKLGFDPAGETVQVASVRELRDPALEVVWERPVALPVYRTPAEFRIFTQEKRTGAPLAAGLRRDGKVILWTAEGIGGKGYERFPYLLHALADLGVEFPFRGDRTWAFFDYSYRMRADPDFLARRWRRAGIAALHAAAWHFYDPEPRRDEYLKKLIEACHRQGVLVYAWLELPHVSEKFWHDHPEWREKTAILQDAHLDWRKLMNLANPACARSVEEGVRKLLQRFDWDGVNLAELYFESLYGPADPQRFTPMNETVRRDFAREAGWDPLDLFRKDSGRHWESDLRSWERFAAYRAELARRLQTEWLETLKKWRPDLDLVLTHIDDQFDTRMRDHLGADSAALLPLLDRMDFTFAIEDPATIWHLGPDRYAEIARRYARLTRRRDRLAVDINIVERYQDVYPTKKQTGVELFQLMHFAAGSFARVMLYFEQSIARVDYDLLAASSAAASWVGDRVETPQTCGVRWKGPVRVNGKPWPATDGETVWIPAGSHRIEPAAEKGPVRLLRVNADLVDARVVRGGAELEYRSSSRAAVLVDVRPARIEVDGREAAVIVIEADGHFTVLLPAGHRVARILVT